MEELDAEAALPAAEERLVLTKPDLPVPVIGQTFEKGIELLRRGFVGLRRDLCGENLKAGKIRDIRMLHVRRIHGVACEAGCQDRRSCEEMSDHKGFDRDRAS